MKYKPVGRERPTATQEAHWIKFMQTDSHATPRYYPGTFHEWKRNGFFITILRVFWFNKQGTK